MNDPRGLDRSRPDEGAALMLRVRAGDHDAFRELVERYHVRVLTLAERFFGDAAAAEDLAQETFLRLFRAAPDYRPTARFETWLYRIVFNLCMNARVHGRRRRAQSIDTAFAPAHEPRDPATVTPAEQAAASEEAAAVRAAVAALPTRQRAVLWMHHFSGLSCAEIGSAAGMSVQGVKSLLFRARENLGVALTARRGRERAAGNAPAASRDGAAEPLFGSPLSAPADLGE